ncbi:MAG: HEPN domain-containing protein [Candidatus Omnitrophica bacterium]|nr:HEPN domain-containing protein [Candidatus Omnitrophota bacterium]
MKLDEKIINRLNELIDLGEKVLATKQFSQVIGADAYVDGQLAHQWVSSVQSLLSRVFGQESEHYKNFSKQVEKEYISYSPLQRAQGVLKSAKNDYENEQLFDVRQLIEAELFNDFIEQAEHLLKSGYYQPAAVIIGCVLEDGLRKLCHKNVISIPEKPKLDSMNIELAKAGIYSKLTQKKITVLADLRNKSAHGQWDQFKLNDVEEMILSVRRIMEEFFS